MLRSARGHFSLRSETVLGTNGWVAPEVLQNEMYLEYAHEFPEDAELQFPNHGYGKPADIYRYSTVICLLRVVIVFGV